MMTDSDKAEFMAAFKSLSAMPLAKAPQEFTPDMARMYWAALCHRSMAEVTLAINEHIRDPERGRFFPTPGDIEAKLPREQELWPTGDEAWAMMPKDENRSGALCDEMAQAYDVAKELIWAGDMIAARRAFIDAYDRRVTEAKREHRIPKWWPSLGDDREGRDIARRKVVELNNAALPVDQRKALPEPEQAVTVAALEYCAENAGTQTKEVALDAIKNLRGILG